jgi:hypothetical protein
MMDSILLISLEKKIFVSKFSAFNKIEFKGQWRGKGKKKVILK